MRSGRTSNCAKPALSPTARAGLLAATLLVALSSATASHALARPQHYWYGPFGDFRTESHPGGEGCTSESLTCQAPYTFTGHLYDQESGLFYFGARYYDPETGRFLSQDPVAGDALNPPSLHKYLYAYSSPMNYTDPWGEYGQNSIYEKLAPTIDDLPSMNQANRLVDMATAKGGAFTSRRAEYEALKAGEGGKRLRSWSQGGLGGLLGLFNDLYQYSVPQDDRGYVIFPENAPKSLRAPDFRKGIVGAYWEVETSPDRRAYEDAFFADWLSAGFNPFELRRVEGLAGAANAVGGGEQNLRNIADHGLLGGLFLSSLQGGASLGQIARQGSEQGWGKTGKGVLAGIERPFLEDDPLHASETTVGLGLAAYTLGRSGVSALGRMGQLGDGTSLLRQIEGLGGELAEARALSASPGISQWQWTQAVPGYASVYSEAVTPWGRRVLQRSDVDWAFIRPQGASMPGLQNLEAAELGYAPVRMNPVSGRLNTLVLHHLNKDPGGVLGEVWSSTHDLRHAADRLAGRGLSLTGYDPLRGWRSANPAWDSAFRVEQSVYWRWYKAGYVPPAGGVMVPPAINPRLP